MSIKFLMSLSPFKGRSNKSIENGMNNDVVDEEKTVTWDSIRHKSQIGTSKTRLKIKAAQSWSKVRSEVSHVGRHVLEEEIRLSSENADPHRVMKLGHLCLDEAFSRRPKYKMKLIKSGVLLMEWAHLHELEFNAVELRLLAKGHYEVWCSSGINVEEYNLMRSVELYELAIKHIENIAKPEVLIEFCRVLQHFGDEERASKISMDVVKAFESSPDYANFIFYAGCLYKSVGLHDIAATYLFESIQCGLPRYFSKLDIMFLISRNIEENAKKTGENCLDAYRIVYDHAKIDGHLPEQLQYENWIGNSDTWRELGDKCTLHGMYSIARDLYGQGLLRDDFAFLKPKLWFNFAKSCYRCGRTSDAELAIQQALTMAPYNQQLIKVLKSWSTSNLRSHFNSVLEEGIDAIVEFMPPAPRKRATAVQLIQNNYRSYKKVREVLLGVGKRRGIKKMSSSLGIVTEHHPLLMSFKASWMGVVASIRFHELVSDRIEKIKLSRPFCPPLRRGSPLVFVMKTSIKKEEKFTTDSVASTEHTISIRFEDVDSDGFLERDFTLRVSRSSTSTSTDDVKCSNMTYLPIDTGTLKLQIMNDDSDITTNIAAIEIARGCYNFHDCFYMYRLYQQENCTNITITQLSTNKRVLITVKREHIDRSIKVSRVIGICGHIIENHPTISSYLLSGQVDISNDSVHKRFDVVYHQGKKTFTTSIATANKNMAMLTVRLSELKGGCVFGSSFENYIGHQIE